MNSLGHIRHLAYYLSISSAVSWGVMAAEYHGVVKSSGLPVPGVTITASQGDRRLSTTTDDRGAFAFAELAEGAWTLETQMLGFAAVRQEIRIPVSAGVVEFTLQLLTQDALARSLRGAPFPGSQLQAPRPVAGSKPLSPAPPSNAMPGERRAAPGGSIPPWPRAAGSGSNSKAGGFQRLDVTQSSNTETFGTQDTIKTEEVADLNQRAANSFLVQGSVSSAMGLPPQNDWGRFPGMDPMGGLGMMGGPGMTVGGPGGPGEGLGGNAGMAAQGGVRTAGGGGGFGGGPGGGGPGGGGPGGGGPGGGGPGGGPGGPGGPGGGFGPGSGPPPGMPDWERRRGAMAFGNGRRDPRNMYMGNVMFSLNNSAWDAQSFSVTGSSIDKPAYANARGGIMFGGPLRIPKLIGVERRILFTIDFQFQRNRNGTVSQPVNMPTALERTGDFSQTQLQGASVAIYDPTTGLPFPGNKIPPGRISATSLELLSYFPSPNLPYASRNYQTSWTSANNSYNLNSRVSNIRIGSKDRLNAGVGYQDTDSRTPNMFDFVDTGSGRGINANLAWSHNITSRLINNVQYTFSRNRQLSTPYFANRTNVAAGLGIAGTSQAATNWGPPNLSLTNYGSLTDGNYSLSRNQTHSLGESLMWIHGTHNFVFGGDFRRMQFNQFADNNGRGTYTFDGQATSYLVDGVAQSGTGYDLADLMLGLPTTASIRYGSADKYLRGSGYDGFVNDDWRINGRFTINAGIRWEYATPVTEKYNRLVNLDVAPGYTAIAAVEAGQTAPYSGVSSKALVRGDRNNFSPRIGLGWRPFTNDSTVVRAGYGVYYNSSVYNLIASNMAQQPPFAQVLNASSSSSTPLTIDNAFLLASSQSLVSTYAVDPNYRIGYAQTWTVSIQHDLPLAMFATAGYLGTKGTRLDQQFIPNSVAPGATESSLPHGFTYETSNGDSIYHAAQFQLNRRFRSGVGARASYQFSKSIDDAGTGGRGQGNTPVAQNWLDLSAERGLSGFDSRHNLTLQLQYSTGMGRTGGTLVNGWKGGLMKDWTVSGNIRVHSGNPLTATVGGNRSQVSGTAVSNTVRADSTGASVHSAGLLFNTAAFTAPAAGQWGSAGRNTIPGPSVFYLNGSFGRVFRLGERRSADLQLQAQNLLNHVTITSWGTVVESSNYGLATGAAGMRTITVSLRIRF